MAHGALSAELAPARSFAADKQAVDRLTIALGEFSSRLYRANLSRESAERLPAILRVARYYDTAAALAAEIGVAQAELMPPAAPLAVEIAAFRLAVVRLFERADTTLATFTSDVCAQALREVEKRYEPLKAALLIAGSQGTISVVAMENWLVQLSRTRRLAQQVAKAAQHLHALGVARAA
jgi:phosphate:Na+ symporter